MIGNDIIDLELAYENKNWNRERFLNKLFSESEKSTIFDSGNPQFTIWLFWSMKEAAYKANQRFYDLERKFNPHFFDCKIQQISEGKAVGTVRAGENTYFCRSFFDLDSIHTIASISEKVLIDFQTGKKTSEDIKNTFLSRFSNVKNVDKKEIKLQYNQHSIPQLFFKTEKLKTAFSFSHHGRFSAFAYGR